MMTGGTSFITLKQRRPEMIEFNCPNRKYDGTPVVCDLEVMAYAEAHVGDYKPELLKTPGKINALHFVESYLNASVDVQDIRNAVPGMEINGITVFKDAMITVREDSGYVSKLFHAGAIVIDQSVIGMKDGFEQFTIVHEGGHFCMHYPAFCGQDILAARSVMDKIMCRSSMIETDRPENRKWTDRDFMEHQANVYAAAVLMPRSTFVPFVMELNRKAGHKDGIFVRPPIDPFFQYRHWYVFLEEIGQKIAETYGVSESAAYVHMKRCGLIKTEDPKELPLYIRRGIAV